MNDDRSLQQRRIRQIHRLFISGVGLAVVSTGIVAVLGASGTAGAAVFFLICGLGAVAAALGGFIVAIVDEFRRRPVAIARIGYAIAYFLLAAVCIVATVGAASGIGAPA